LIFGSGDLVNALMSLELVDEYRLMVFPVIAGNEKRLFGDVAD
jgi:dihydrofolate reductase